MAENPHAAHLQELLEGLNEPQREAVTHGEGPLLILAGAGSGKTRVLAHRIAFLIYTDQAQAGEILAITFTNKAANEMRERVERLLGHGTRAMWVMTFHAACARILRAEAQRLGYTRQFTIYDQADARRLTKRSADAVGVDPKRFTPSAIHNQISAAKNQLIDAESYRQRVGSQFEEMIADVYDIYERDLHRMNAMDFDDLLFRVVNLLELFEDVRERYRSTFRHVLVDEYQDTNHAQYRMLQLLVGGGRPPQRGEAQPGDRPTYSGPVGHRNLAVVGDDAQCLAEGTLVTMADGTQRPIEDVWAGDMVLAAHGSGDFRPAMVMRRHDAQSRQGVAVTTRSGRQLVSTAEHIHFAGFVRGRTPQLHMTYVMWKRGVGFRVGTSRTYTAGQVKPVVGVAYRMRQEGGDAAWVVSVHASDAEARVAELLLSAQYGLPTIPFNARPGGARSPNSLVGNQALIDRVFTTLDTVASGRKLLADEGLSLRFPHFASGAHTSGRRGSPRLRRRMVVTLCGDRRGETPMHRIAMFGYDQQGREALERLGLSVRPARRGSIGWRYESASADMPTLLSTVERVRGELEFHLHLNARLARNPEGVTNSLPFMPASSLRPGMVMVTAEGDFDVVERVEPAPLDSPVYDLDIDGVHNFIANGLVTHNSIYSFRGADVRNILDFQQDFPDARVVKLEQNYRSTETILRAANAVIANNRGGIAKRLWSELGQGEQIQLRVLDDEYAEARFIVGEIQRLIDEGASRAEIAVLYRTNALSRVLEETLTRADIAYQVIGGTKFFERAEIKDAIAYLSLIANPADVVSFTRVVNSPRRGIGQTSLGRVLAHSESQGIPVWQAAAQPEQVPGLGAAAVKALRRFMDTMEDLRSLAGMPAVGAHADAADADGATRDDGNGDAAAEAGVPVGDLLEALLSQTGYIEALEAERTIESQGRIENLEQLVEGARTFDALAGEGQDTLAAYLQEVALVADADSRSDEGLVTLMTLHNAKGLEYPTVFIAGCEDGVFPHSRAIEEGSLEEERRLFYVGVTRAMRQLYLTHARRRAVFGAQSYGMRSRFLDEIPADLLEEPRQTAFRPGAGWSAGGGAPTVTARRGSANGSWAVPSGAERAAVAAGQEGVSVANQFRLGEDVVHAAFGDGVVTGVEPGGVIVVRFAGDGSERKLMAEYAPVSRR
ncbi:MAG TPA: UvrD-helicase domain-containing protein [Solirubrobacteraceae bacterium]|jgi:DNA helicase-2/ATP-dependent DNA helicase PcrA|nr:UvrD-helicase domain-containing protein [Solirubrobacteraceae bacterium]